MFIEAKNINFTYMPDSPFAVKALKDVNLRVKQGEFLGIIGQTGCGKSTLIQQLAGLMKPDNGQILLNGEDINAEGFDRKLLRRSVGVVFQYPEYQLFEETVGRDVAFGPQKAGMSEQEIKKNVDTALELVGFVPEEIKEISPFDLSGGQKRKVAIAGVLATDPQILILDEPIAGLDPLARESFMQLVRDLNKSEVTIVMISHNMDGLADYANRIVVMDHGKIIEDGTPADVFGNIKKLQSVGLDASEARKAGYLLSQHGIEVPEHIIKIEDLADYLAQILMQEGKDPTC